MRVNPAGFGIQTAYKGKIRYFGYDSNNKLTLQNTPSGIGVHYYDNFTEKLKNIVPKTAEVENAFNKRSNRLGTVYVGDPDEVFKPEDLFSKADYTVKDVAPKYPDIDRISAGYFFKDDTKYEENFKDISDFYDRRKSAANEFELEYRNKLERGYNTADSKEKMDYYIWQQGDSRLKRKEAQDCLNIYNKANDLKGVKSQQGAELGELQEKERSLNYSIKNTKAYIDLKEQTYKFHEKTINSIKDRKDLYDKLTKISEDVPNDVGLCWKGEKNPIGYVRLSIFPNETKTIKEKMGTLDGFINAYKEANANILQSIFNAKAQMASLIKQLAKTQADIKVTEAALNETKAKLIPLFDELKNYYIQHGLK